MKIAIKKAEKDQYYFNIIDHENKIITSSKMFSIKKDCFEAAIAELVHFEEFGELCNENTNR